VGVEPDHAEVLGSHAGGRAEAAVAVAREDQRKRAVGHGGGDPGREAADQLDHPDDLRIGLVDRLDLVVLEVPPRGPDACEEDLVRGLVGPAPMLTSRRPL